VGSIFLRIVVYLTPITLTVDYPPKKMLSLDRCQVQTRIMKNRREKCEFH